MFPDGRRVVSGSKWDLGKVWDVATGKCVATPKNLGRTRNPRWIKESQEKIKKATADRLRRHSDYTPLPVDTSDIDNGKSERERAYRNHVQDLITHNRRLEEQTRLCNY